MSKEENIETQKEQIEMNDFNKKYIQKIDIKENKMKNMLSNTNYIEWLIEFTKKYESFTDNSWLYNPEELSENDFNSVSDLNLLYEIIDHYAEKNYIYPMPCNFGNYYKIKFNNIAFEIGLIAGQGVVNFCNKIELNNDISLEFIDYNDIINNKEYAHVQNINRYLSCIERKIMSAYYNGVPAEALKNALKKTIEEIKLKENKEKNKVLKKK